MRFQVFLAVFFLGCTGVRTTTPPANPEPTPAPISAQPSSPISKSNTWTFHYTPGAVSYRITRKAVIENADSATEQRTSTNLTHEVVTLASGDSTINAAAVIDTFSTAVEPGPALPMQVPTQISASLTAKALTIYSSDTSCSPTSSILATDLNNLLVPFPSPLNLGMVWRDTVDVKGCQAGIIMSARVTRSFMVTGEVPGDTRPLVAITRTDSAELNGEGGLEQHRVSTHADGTGTARYYLNTETGQVIHLVLNQILTFDILAEAKRQRLKQETTEDFTIVP
jgi:hypothetical protein